MKSRWRRSTTSDATGATETGVDTATTTATAVENDPQGTTAIIIAVAIRPDLVSDDLTDMVSRGTARRGTTGTNDRVIRPTTATTGRTNADTDTMRAEEREKRRRSRHGPL